MIDSRVLKILMALSLIALLNGPIYAQDDDGGGDGGDMGGDIGGDVGDVADSDWGDDTVEYTEEQSVEEHEVVGVADTTVSTTTTTSTTHAYGPGHVYYPASDVVVGGIAAGAAAGVVAGSVAKSATDKSASPQKPAKNPTVVKKRPQEKTEAQTADKGSNK